MWGVWPGRASVLIATGALAAALLFAAQAQAPGRGLRALRVAVVAGATLSLAIAVAALVEPPFDRNRAAGAAYIATALVVAVGLSAANGLRRA